MKRWMNFSFLLLMFCTNRPPKHNNWTETGRSTLDFPSHGQSSGRSGVVFSIYFEWACSVLYYSYGRTHTHDPATHLAIVPMQPVLSKGLIKQFGGSGPSPSTALLFTAVLLPKSLHNCFWLGRGKKKPKKLKSSYWLPLWEHLPPEEHKSRVTAHCQAPCQPLSTSFQRKNHPLSPVWKAEHLSTPITRIDVTCKYVHSTHSSACKTDRQTDR